MSLKAYIHVWEHSKAKGTSLLALLALADNANEKSGECWPGMATVANRIRASEDQARRLINQLVKAREVIRVTRPGKTHLYVLVMLGVNCKSYEELCAKYEVDPESETPIKDKRGGKRKKKDQPLANMQPPEGVANMPAPPLANMQGEGVANMQGEPFIDPSFEPKEIPPTPTTNGVTPGETPAPDSAACGASLTGEIPKPRKGRKMSDDEYRLYVELFPVVAQGSFGKPYQKLGTQRKKCGSITKAIIYEIPGITPESLTAVYKRYFDKHGEQIKKDASIRMKSSETIADWLQQIEDENKPIAPRKIANPNCDDCGGDGVAINRSTGEGGPCHCLHYPEKDGAK